MRMIKALIMVILGFTTIFYITHNCHAQEKTTKVKKPRRRGGPIVLEEIVIEGRVQKPQAFYILQRAGFGYKITQLEAHYQDAIAETTRDEIF